MNSLSVLSHEIRLLDGFYSLNDLHRASNTEKAKAPNEWLRNQQTKELIKEIKDQTGDSRFAPIRTFRGGKGGSGTYACKELVYAYAMWISAKFHLVVIRAFDAMVVADARQPSLPSPLTPAHQREIQKLVAAKVHASNAGRGGYSTIYRSIKDRFHVGTYKDVPDDRYEELMLYIETIEIEAGELLRTLPLSDDQIRMIIEAVTEKINAEYIHTSKQGSEPKRLAPPPKPPAKHYPPRTLYDLDYIEDLRGDDSQVRNVGWWRFERPGGESNWAGEGTSDQGEHFFQQTRELAKVNPKDAVEAITWCLMHFTGGHVEGVGFHGCEVTFCQQIARAAVAWMAAAHEVQPPSYERGRRHAS